MILRRYVRSTTVALGLTVALTGSAMAADVTVDTTGAGSNQEVVVNNASEVKLNNTNVVWVNNENVQQATTGDVTANKNTTIGGVVESGDASNNNATATSVSIANESAAVLGNEVVPGSSVDPTSNAGTGATGGAGATATPKVLGAATTGGLGGGAAVLPVTGGSAVDVSALRSSLQRAGEAPTATLAKQSRFFTGAMLLTATLLSLLGAVLSAWYGKRQEERV